MSNTRRNIAVMMYDFLLIPNSKLKKRDYYKNKHSSLHNYITTSQVWTHVKLENVLENFFSHSFNTLCTKVCCCNKMQMLWQSRSLYNLYTVCAACTCVSKVAIWPLHDVLTSASAILASCSCRDSTARSRHTRSNSAQPVAFTSRLSVGHDNRLI